MCYASAGGSRRAPGKESMRSLSYAVLGVLLLGCGYSQHTPTARPAVSQLQTILPLGTAVPIVLMGTVQTGDGSAATATFVVARDIRGSDGSVAIPGGSPVLVEVLERRQRRLGRQGILRIRALGAVDREGRMVPLAGEHEVNGQRRVGLVIGLTIGMLFVYPGLNFLHLLHRGRGAQLPAGFAMNTVVGQAQ